MSQNNLNILEENASPAEAINIRQYWHIFQERRWLVLATFIAIVILTAFYLFSATSIYYASARLQIDRETENSLRMEGFSMDGSREKDYLQTQYKNLKSRSLIKTVLERTIQNATILKSIKANKRRFIQIANETGLKEAEIIKRIEYLSDAGFFGDKQYEGDTAPELLVLEGNRSFSPGLFVFPLEEDEKTIPLTEEELLDLLSDHISVAQFD